MSNLHLTLSRSHMGVLEQRCAALSIAVVLVVLTGLQSPPASAAQDVPCASDYSRLVQNGAYVFVMLAREEESPDNPAGCLRRDEELRSRYPTSGLFAVEGSADPLWTVEWYSPAVTVSSDGSYLIRWGSLAPAGDYSVLALALYDGGRQTAAYSVDRLVSLPFLLPVIDGHYTWVHGFELDDESRRLTLATELGEHFIFDVSTGQAVSNWVPPVPRYLVAAGAAVTLLVALPVLVRTSRRDPETSPDRNPLRRYPG